MIRYIICAVVSLIIGIIIGWSLMSRWMIVYWGYYRECWNRVLRDRGEEEQL